MADEMHSYYVPVGIVNSYWSAQLYIPAADSAEDAKATAETLIDELVDYAPTARPIMVGEAVLVR